MTAAQRTALTSKLNQLNRRYEKVDDKITFAEREGDMEKANLYERKQDMIYEKMKGIIETLTLLGYDVVCNSTTDYEYMILGE